VDPPQDEKTRRRFGYSRDKTRDCVQVVIALIVTAAGFSAGLRSVGGLTLDQTDAEGIFAKDRNPIRKAERIWLMDRGIPTEEIFEEMRTVIRRSSMWWAPPRGTFYTVGEATGGKTLATARGQSESENSWAQGELYVLAESHDRIAKERRCAGAD